MKQDDTEVTIESRDYWFKVVEFLQTNWALSDQQEQGQVVVWFIGDTSGVFDELRFASTREAEASLVRNGFRRCDSDAEAASFLTPPSPPFVVREHPNGRIYSSGRFWS